MEKSYPIIFEEKFDVTKMALPYLQKSYRTDCCSFELNFEAKFNGKLHISAECWPTIPTFGTAVDNMNVLIMEDTPEAQQIDADLVTKGYHDFFGGYLCVSREAETPDAWCHVELYRNAKGNLPYSDIFFSGSGETFRKFKVGKTYKIYLKKV